MNFSEIRIKIQKFSFRFKIENVIFSHFDQASMCYNIHHQHHNLYSDRLVQERRNSIADALELHLSCTNPSLCNETHGLIQLCNSSISFCKWAGERSNFRCSSVAHKAFISVTIMCRISAESLLTIVLFTLSHNTGTVTLPSYSANSILSCEVSIICGHFTESTDKSPQG